MHSDRRIGIRDEVRCAGVSGTAAGGDCEGDGVGWLNLNRVRSAEARHILKKAIGLL